MYKILVYVLLLSSSTKNIHKQKRRQAFYYAVFYVVLVNYSFKNIILSEEKLKFAFKMPYFSKFTIYEAIIVSLFR